MIRICDPTLLALGHAVAGRQHPDVRFDHVDHTVSEDAAALKELETTLLQEPNRFRSVGGAARAAAAGGDRRAAASYYARLLAIGARADQPERRS